MNRIALALALVAGAALFAAGAAYAQADGPCLPDMQRLCADVPAGGGAKLRCLLQHESELSPECRQRMAQGREKVRAQVEAVQAACKEDAAKHCAGVEPGGGALASCLRKHEPELSTPCREALPTRQP